MVAMFRFACPLAAGFTTQIKPQGWSSFTVSQNPHARLCVAVVAQPLCQFRRSWGSSRRRRSSFSPFFFSSRRYRSSSLWSDFLQRRFRQRRRVQIDDADLVDDGRYTKKASNRRDDRISSQINGDNNFWNPIKEIFQSRKPWPLRLQEFARTSTGQLVVAIFIAWLIVSGRLAFIFESIFILFLVFTVPAVAVSIFRRFWITKQPVRVEAPCPVCRNVVECLPQTSDLVQCPSCQSILRYNMDNFQYTLDNDFSRSSGNPYSNPYEIDPKRAIVEIDAKEVD